MSFFQLFSMGSKEFKHTEHLALLEKCERLELKKLQLRAERHLRFLIVQSKELSGGPSVVVTINFTVAWTQQSWRCN